MVIQDVLNVLNSLCHSYSACESTHQFLISMDNIVQLLQDELSSLQLLSHQGSALTSITLEDLVQGLISKDHLPPWNGLSFHCRYLSIWCDFCPDLVCILVFHLPGKPATCINEAWLYLPAVRKTEMWPLPLPSLTHKSHEWYECIHMQFIQYHFDLSLAQVSTTSVVSFTKAKTPWRQLCNFHSAKHLKSRLSMMCLSFTNMHIRPDVSSSILEHTHTHGLLSTGCEGLVIE